MIKEVFISYSNVDRKFAKRLAKFLDDMGIEYFLDTKDIMISDSITQKIQNGLRKCSIVVFIISPESLKLKWVQYEIGQATALGKEILAWFTHPSIDVPNYLRDLKYATSLKQVKEYLEKNCEDIYPKTIDGELFTESIRYPLQPLSDKCNHLLESVTVYSLFLISALIILSLPVINIIYDLPFLASIGCWLATLGLSYEIVILFPKLNEWRKDNNDYSNR